jgi:hypothetical protein
MLFCGMNSNLVASDLSASRLYRSPHYLGRADTGIAMTDNCDAIFYNPAALASGKGLYKQTCLASPFFELSLATRDLYRQVAVEKTSSVTALRQAIGRPQHFGVQNMTALVFRRAAVSVVGGAQTDILVSKSKENGGLETVDSRVTIASAATFSLAETFFNDALQLGITAKYIPAYADVKVSASVVDAQDLATTVSSDQITGYSSGTGLDFGLLWQSSKGSRPSFGVLIRNLGNTELTSSVVGATPAPLKQTVNLGLAFRPGTKFSVLKILLDYHDVTSAYESNNLKKIHFGSEISLRGWFGMMFGLNQGYATSGLYFDTRVMRFDIGMYTEEAGSRVGDRPDSRFYFRFMAGL